MAKKCFICADPIEDAANATDTEWGVAHTWCFAEWDIPCKNCGSTVNVTFEPSPFALEVYGDETPVWMCAACRQEGKDDT